MFVTFEGTEGAGKSTALREAAGRLRQRGVDVLTTREPGAGTFGGAVRDLLLHGEAMPPQAELFLFLADRANHVAQIVRPALARGQWVLCDRFADSTQVYQAHVRGLDATFVREANRFATGGLRPDLTILLDLDPEIGLARVGARHQADHNRLDREPIAFHRAVREGFLQLAAEEPERWHIVDAAATPEKVFDQVTSCLFSALR